jgi:hypothetical protein
MHATHFCVGRAIQVPMLASDLYYKSKFSSTVVTSMITGE